jgi:hypothetical protein
MEVADAAARRQNTPKLKVFMPLNFKMSDIGQKKDVC